MDGRIQVFPASLLVMLLLSALLANGVRGDACVDKTQVCMTNRNTLITASPPNATATVTQCHWSLLECVAGLRDTCRLKEDYITFQEVATLSQQLCQEISKTASDSECEMMGECVLGSELMRKLMSNSTSPQVRASLILDSQTWCRYLEVSAGCYVKSNSSCQVDPTFLSFMTRQHSYLKTACYSSAHGGKAALGNSILILLLAVLTIWAQSFL